MSHSVRTGVALAAALALFTPAAQAQRTDFTMTPGNYTAPNPNNFIGFGVWGYTPSVGWAVSGRNLQTASLLSEVYTATGGAAGIAFEHNFNFELNLFGGCFDGGLLLASINGAAYSPITAMTGGTQYRGPISTTGGSPRAGQNAFCGFPNNTQGSYVTSSFMTTLAAGTQVQFAFEGAWDSQRVNSGANWTIRAVELTGLTNASVVPEPSTYALMGTGLLALVGVNRRRTRTRA